jgi:hypothetical protein
MPRVLNLAVHGLLAGTMSGSSSSETMMSDWKEWLTLSPVGEGVQQVFYRNGKFIGNLVQDVDGYWKYSFPNGHGLWDASNFQMLADMLTELNMTWDNEINEYFKAERERDEQEG